MYPSLRLLEISTFGIDNEEVFHTNKSFNSIVKLCRFLTSFSNDVSLLITCDIITVARTNTNAALIVAPSTLNFYHAP